MTFPQMAEVKQTFDDQHIQDVPVKVIEEMAGLKLHNSVRSGDTIAVTGGSRGITDIDVITKTMVEELKWIIIKPG